MPLTLKHTGTVTLKTPRLTLRRYRTEDAPAATLAREDGWRAFRVEGVLDFSLTGILSGLSGVLAENGIGIFAVSSYNTDYILVKAVDFARAMAALEQAGHEVIGSISPAR